MPTSYRNPYTIGGWVSGRRYYGHHDLRQYVLLGSDNYIWVMGSRRVGKTSLLRQLAQQGRKDYLSIYWDMQGCVSAEDLQSELLFALEDQESQLKKLGIRLDEIAQDNAGAMLRKVCRQADKKGRRILLLIDEPESLVAIARTDPAAVQRLRAAIQRPANLRVVMASTRSLARLHDATRDWPTSPFLYDFAPLYISRLSKRDAEQLIRQEQRNPVRVGQDALRRIHHYTGDHPYLLQWLCYHLYRSDHSLRSPRKQDIVLDSMLTSLFRLQFRHLSPTERKILLHLTERLDGERGIAAKLGMGVRDVRMYLYVMMGLGYVRPADSKRLAIGNSFLHRWLVENLDKLSSDDAGISDASVQEMAQASLQEQVIYWQEQLKIYRERLGKLEMLLARSGNKAPSRLQQTILEHRAHIQRIERKIDAFHLTHDA